MKTFTIGWLNKCRCGNKSHAVKTARGNESALWDDDAVKCNSCGRGGVIQVCEGQARVLWETDEEMAEGKPMSTLTKEWLLKTIAELEEERDATPGAVNEDAAMSLAAMKRALASLEAEAVALRDERSGSGGISKKPGFNDLPHGTPLYAAPPAPVVPAEIRNRLKAEGLAELLKDARGYEPLTAEQWETLTNNWHQTFVGLSGKAYACRAAMLQGAEQTNYRAIVERIAEIIHGKVTDIDLLTVTVKSMKDKLQK
ncbi:hypothetical protein ACK8HE_12525 [Enterobacter hormaechei]|uniref:hypothetical protein n=1 Tax=Enterobacter hormaechei TaxID=158836 RepID=UPI0039DF5A2A